MKAIYTVRQGLTIEVEASTQVGLYEELASAAEVFGESCCGACRDAAIVPIFRHVGKLEFAEWACTKCGARLSLGNTMEGDRLFPIRALDANGKPDREHGTRGDHNGWTTYRGPNRDAQGHGPQTPTPRKAPPAASAPPAAPRKPASPVATAMQKTLPPIPEGNTHKAHPEPLPVSADRQKITAAQAEQIRAELQQRFIPDAVFCERYGYASLEAIPARYFTALLDCAKRPDGRLMAMQQEAAAARRTATNGRR